MGRWRVSYLIDGGAPAGISILPGDEGCRRNKTRINIMTIHGNKRTSPKGIEMEELPFKRMRRRKKANRGESRSALRDTSSREGRLGEFGRCFASFCTKLMIAAVSGRCVYRDFEVALAPCNPRSRQIERRYWCKVSMSDGAVLYPFRCCTCCRRVREWRAPMVTSGWRGRSPKDYTRLGSAEYRRQVRCEFYVDTEEQK